MTDLIQQRMDEHRQRELVMLQDFRTTYGTFTLDEELHEDASLLEVVITALVIGGGCFFAMVLWLALPECIPL